MDKKKNKKVYKITKKILLILLTILLIAMSIPRKLNLKDGGTVVYDAFLYKLINWNKLNPPGPNITGREFHIFPTNFHSIEYYLDPMPPHVMISNNDKSKSVLANIGTYTWKDKVEGKERNIIADSVHPIKMEYKDVINVKAMDRLYFENEDLEIEKVEIYKEDNEKKWNVDFIIDNNEKSITLPVLDFYNYILVITAKSEQGTVDYSIKINVMIY